MSIFDKVSQKTEFQSFVADAISHEVGKIGAFKDFQSDALPIVNTASKVAGQVANGNLTGALDSVFSSGVLNRFIDPHNYYFNSARRHLARSPVTANLTMKEIEQICSISYAIERAKKNLFLISMEPYRETAAASQISQDASSVLSQAMEASGLNGVGNIAKNVINDLLRHSDSYNVGAGGGITSIHNMMATAVTYSPITFDNDPSTIGSSVIDGAKIGQPTDLAITTMDDKHGTIKRFFKQMASRTIHADGTVGVLVDGLIRVRILHAFVSEATNVDGFAEEMLVRPVSVEYESSRHEDDVQEFTMNFIQTDTFL